MRNPKPVPKSESDSLTILPLQFCSLLLWPLAIWRPSKSHIFHHLLFQQQPLCDSSALPGSTTTTSAYTNSQTDPQLHQPLYYKYNNGYYHHQQQQQQQQQQSNEYRSPYGFGSNLESQQNANNYDYYGAYENPFNNNNNNNNSTQRLTSMNSSYWSPGETQLLMGNHHQQQQSSYPSFSASQMAQANANITHLWGLRFQGFWLCFGKFFFTVFTF